MASSASTLLIRFLLVCLALPVAVNSVRTLNLAIPKSFRGTIAVQSGATTTAPTATTLVPADPNTFVWTERAPLPVAKSDHVVVFVNNLAYVAGGCVSKQPVGNTCLNITDRMDIYNPATDSWSLGATMPRPRYRYMAAALQGKIYIISGRTIPDDKIIEPVDVYDIASNTWTTLPQQKCWDCLYRSDGTAFALGTRIYVTGGYDPFYSTRSDVAVLDLTSDPQQFVTGAVPNTPMSAGDQGAVAALGYGWVYGGWKGSDFCTPQDGLQRYDPTSNTWQLVSNSGPNGTLGRGDMGMVELFDDVFVLGGETKSTPCDVTTGGANAISVPVASVEHYDVDNLLWETIAPLPITIFRFTSFQYNGHVYAIGGQEAEVTGNPPTYPLSDALYSVDVNALKPASSGSHSTMMLSLNSLLFCVFFSPALFALFF